ncbi:MAG: hypothetical protein IPO67_31785 [Deltaproteobacteria bacterium]|nr:hypothetical protein [Deltaproteobacteria bacterium]
MSRALARRRHLRGREGGGRVQAHARALRDQHRLRRSLDGLRLQGRRGRPLHDHLRRGDLRGSFDGEGTLRSTQKATWTESDTWLEEVASTVGTTGRIPSYDYLTTEDDFGYLRALYNEYDAANCQSADCTLTVTDTCMTGFNFTADRTDIKPEV